MNTKIVIAQLNLTVGDIAGNCQKICDAIKQAKKDVNADLIVFPELAITGYPPEDLLHRENFYHQTKSALNTIAACAQGIDVVVGYPENIHGQHFNAAAWIKNKKIVVTYHKQKLPNYGVFDEQRYFVTGNAPVVIELNGTKFGVLICEDIWYPEPIQQAKNAGAEVIICINASPFSMYKIEQRWEVITQRINEAQLPIMYVNLVGGQDELVFDGGSFVVNQQQQICAQAKYFAEELLTVELKNKPHPSFKTTHIDLTHPRMNHINVELPTKWDKQIISRIYAALKFGIQDYVNKNNFNGVIIGLSGGVDSALTLALAVDALGADRVTAVAMPSPYNSPISAEDAAQQAKTMRVKYHVIEINTLLKDFLASLTPIFAGAKADATEENIQARIRGVLLMAISNKTKKMVLSTGNKSELAVGYCTIYGDMVGGFCALKDVFKTLVYALANYRNTISPVIPQRVIDRAPSAELAPNQTDQDSLPPYDTLDQILHWFIEQDVDPEEIIARGFDQATVKKVVNLVLNNEYKRRQSPPGVRISEKAFGRDRRYPITSKYLK